jgi:diacylglycerol kinase (ATP)
VRRVTDSGRAFGAEVAYYKSILSTFFHYQPMVVHASSNDWTWNGITRSLAIANGKYYGHGLCIAPDAKVDDDMFTAFICGNVSVLDFIIHSQKLKKGKHITLPEVSYRDTKSVSLTAESLCLIEGDGEILGKLPAKVELIDRKIDFLM